MERKNNGLVAVLITIIIVLVAFVVLYMTGIISFNKTNTKQESNSSENNVPVDNNQQNPDNENNNVPNNETNSNQVVSFDPNKCINTDLDSYKVSESKNYLLDEGKNEKIVQFDKSNDSKKVVVSVNWNNAINYFGLNNISSTENSNYEMTFNKNVKDIVVGWLGQSQFGATAIFLMEDGTLEKLKIYDALQNRTFNTSTISGVSDISKLLDANVPSQPVGGYATILAQKADGSFYDLARL